jgi:hypothetical protein
MLLAPGLLLVTTNEADLESVKPKPITPLGKIITADDYPPMSLYSGQQGSVKFRLRVNQFGKPDGCVIEISSRWPVLDNATCDLLLSRANFYPARNSKGEAERGDYSASISWKLPDPDLQDRTPTIITITSQIGSDGQVSNCEGPTDGFAASLGGCDLFGNTQLLTKMLEKPLLDVKTVQVRIAFLFGGAVPKIDNNGALLKRVLDVDFDIAADGTVQNCKSTPIVYGGRVTDPCEYLKSPSLRWKPDLAGQTRKAAFYLDVISWPR